MILVQNWAHVVVLIVKIATWLSSKIRGVAIGCVVPPKHLSSKLVGKFAVQQYTKNFSLNVTSLWNAALVLVDVGTRGKPSLSANVV